MDANPPPTYRRGLLRISSCPALALRCPRAARPRLAACVRAPVYLHVHYARPCASVARVLSADSVCEIRGGAPYAVARSARSASRRTAHIDRSRRRPPFRRRARDFIPVSLLSRSRIGPDAPPTRLATDVRLSIPPRPPPPRGSGPTEYARRDSGEGGTRVPPHGPYDFNEKKIS